MRSIHHLCPVVVIVLLSACSDGKQKGSAATEKIDPVRVYMNDRALLGSPLYEDSVLRHLRTRTLALLASDTALQRRDNQWNTARSRIALDLFTDSVVRDHWLYAITKDQIENYGIKNTEGLMDDFRAHCRNEAFQAEITALYKADATARKGHAIMTYKSVDGFALDAHVFQPLEQKGLRPAILLFHGGSWYQGKCDWMFGACEAYAEKGMVAIAIEYRLYDRHGVPPSACVKDARSAVRWVRANATELGIDPHRVAVRGFSAGGHLAACTALTGLPADPGEDTTISCRPDAMILVSSCFDPLLDRWFVEQVRTEHDPLMFSPLHRVRKGFPPTLIVHASEDRMCPYRTAEQFSNAMTENGDRCELVRIDGAGHFFVFEDAHRERYHGAMNGFLASLGYLP